MKVLVVDNAHVALSQGLHLLDNFGLERQSRNGPVRMLPQPVTTVYRKPLERVVFWPERDANPFFHLAESLWMLAGRWDIITPARYAKNMLNFSDDGVTQHAAYGRRWRNWFRWTSEDFSDGGTIDQLPIIAKRLKANPDDRRCVLQMWDPEADLDSPSKDVACNTTATFQIGWNGDLDLTVFCRSNDIIWGAYGANCVHFPTLLEYMAHWIGVPVGTFYQVSVNWHAYVDKLAPLADLPRNKYSSPYHESTVQVLPMTGGIEELDEGIRSLLERADGDLLDDAIRTKNTWLMMCETMLRAHELWRTHKPPEKFVLPWEELMEFTKRCPYMSSELLVQPEKVDWIVSAKQWLRRRWDKWQGIAAVNA